MESKIIDTITMMPSWEDVSIAMTILGIVAIICLSFTLMFFWENKVVWWARLPIINLLTLVCLLILGFVEECYLTFHPSERTKYIRTSIFQKFF